MVTKKDLIVAVLCTFCLTSTLFMMTRTRSSPDIGEYDPWIDLNDDGYIDVFDAVTLAAAAGTFGTPINKTALLLELLTKIEQLNATVIEQQNTINNLNNTIVYLNETVVYLNSTKGLGNPDYDSGWVSLTGYANWFTHNLQTTRLLVYIMGKGSDGTIHQISYGGDVGGGGNNGVFWSALDETKLAVCRVPGDTVWVQARVMIWKISQP
jgi:hypothetical protein